MTNSNPVAKFKKGQKKVPGSGRQSGSINSFGRDLKEALLDAAQEVVLHGPHIALGESATTS